MGFVIIEQVWLLLRMAELFRKTGNQWTGPQRIEKSLHDV